MMRRGKLVTIAVLFALIFAVVISSPALAQTRRFNLNLKDSFYRFFDRFNFGSDPLGVSCFFAFLPENRKWEVNKDLVMTLEPRGGSGEGYRYQITNPGGSAIPASLQDPDRASTVRFTREGSFAIQVVVRDSQNQTARSDDKSCQVKVVGAGGGGGGGLPKLVARSLSSSPVTITVGTRVTFSGTVANAGTARTDQSVARFCLESLLNQADPPRPQFCLIGQLTAIAQPGVAALNAGQTSQLIVSWTASAIGRYAVHFCANLNSTPEVAELTDRCKTSQVTVGPPPNRPPVAEASVNPLGFFYPRSAGQALEVYAGEPVRFSLDAHNDINNDLRASYDPDGWDDPQKGVSSGGKCIWSSSDDRKPPFNANGIIEITNPSSPFACSLVNELALERTFKKTGTYRYNLQIFDKPQARSNIATVSVNVVFPQGIGLRVYPSRLTVEKIRDGEYEGVVCTDNQTREVSLSIMPVTGLQLSFFAPSHARPFTLSPAEPCKRFLVIAKTNPSTTPQVYDIRVSAQSRGAAELTATVQLEVVEPTGISNVSCKVNKTLVRTGEEVVFTAEIYPLNAADLRYEWFLVTSEADKKIGEGNPFKTNFTISGLTDLFVRVGGKNREIQVDCPRVEVVGTDISTANCRVGFSPEPDKNSKRPLKVDLTITGESNTHGYFALTYDEKTVPKPEDYLIFNQDNHRREQVPIVNNLTVIHVLCKDAAGRFVEMSQDKRVYDFRSSQTSRPSENITLRGKVQVLKASGRLKGEAGYKVKYSYADGTTAPVVTTSGADGSYTLSGILANRTSANDRLVAYKRLPNHRGLKLEHLREKRVDLGLSEEAQQGKPVTDPVFTELNIRSGTTEITNLLTPGINKIQRVVLDYGVPLKQRIVSIARGERAISQQIAQFAGTRRVGDSLLSGRYFGISPAGTGLPWCTAFVSAVVGWAHGPDLVTNSAQTMATATFNGQIRIALDTSRYKLPKRQFSDVPPAEIAGTLGLATGHIAIHTTPTETLNGNFSDVVMCNSGGYERLGDFLPVNE